ncbi:hypothetical protein [Microbacterium sp. LWH3-1.2]
MVATIHPPVRLRLREAAERALAIAGPAGDLPLADAIVREASTA